MMSGGPRGDVLCTADPVVSTAVSGGAPAVGRAEQLLCIDGDRSFTVTMPGSGELVIGRGPDATLSVDDPLVSRAHALLLAVPDGLRLSDLGSRHGTLLNGERLAEPRLVGSGDVITIGGTLLVVRRPQRASTKRTVEHSQLLGRLADELARVAQYERELSVIVFRSVDRDDPAAVLAAIAGRLRAMDAAATIGPRYGAVVAPELGPEDAEQFARGVSAGSLGVGIATAPFDGIDADALLAAARAAAMRSDVAHARDTAETIAAGGRQITIGDPAMAR